MLRIKHRPAFAVGLARVAILLSFGFILLVPQSGYADDPPLRFFKNYFVTGDYAVAGKSLWRKGINGKIGRAHV